MEKKEFLDWLSQYTDAQLCMDEFANQSNFFRINTLKMSKEQFESFSKLKRSEIPFYNLAYRLDEEKNYEIGRTWEYFLGYIYPQSLPSIVASLVLNPNPEDLVLDVAASPGSKFSHMAMLMKNRGILVGNDVKTEKISALYATINRMNILNCFTTIRDGVQLNWKERFTKVLLDAPCTALGSGESAPDRWEIENSQSISRIQKKMLFSAFDALKPGGELVYSTCTYAKEENEEVVQTLIENVSTAKLMPLGIDFPHETGLSEFGSEFKNVARIYPQTLNSEGFFISKIKKVSE